MSNPFHYSELLYPLTKGDVAGHAFHGNQFTAGQGGGAKDTADKIMDAVNRYGDENPDAQMNKGWQTAMEQAKMIGENKMAIPKSLVDSATKEDLDKLTDNNYHSARTAIEQQRPELADKPSTREVNLGNYFKSESLLYPLTKGDVAGHAFHGNQYTEGSMSDTATKLSKYVADNRGNLSPSDAHDVADSHAQHADVHRQIADALRTTATGVALGGMGNTKLASAMLKEAALHDKAADAHDKAADTVLKNQGEWGGKLGEGEKMPTSSQVSAASSAAAKATVAASGARTSDLLGGQVPNLQLPLGASY